MFVWNKKFFVVQFLCLVMFSFLNLLPYLQAYRQPWRDGITKIGFPFIFIAWGGHPDYFRFAWKALVMNIAIAFTGTFVIALLLNKVWPANQRLQPTRLAGDRD